MSCKITFKAEVAFHLKNITVPTISLKVLCDYMP